MPIAHVADSTADVAGQGATNNLVLPAGANGTQVVVAVFVSTRVAVISPNVVTPPAGWSRIGTELTANNGVGEITLSAFWALGSVAALGFSNSQTLTLNQGYAASSFSGVDLGTPIDVTGTANNSTGGAADVVNSIVIATPNALHLLGIADLGAHTFNTPASFTQNANGATNSSCSLMYNPTPKSTGATGTVTVGISVSDATDIIAGIPFALRPAGIAGQSLYEQLTNDYYPDNRVFVIPY